MPEPVKLSRERWEMLRHAADPVVPSLWGVVLDNPLETQGVIFLPAEYVPMTDAETLSWRHDEAMRLLRHNGEILNAMPRA